MLTRRVARRFATAAPPTGGSEPAKQSTSNNSNSNNSNNSNKNNKSSSSYLKWLPLVLGPALVLGYVWSERRYWQRVDADFRASLTKQLANSASHTPLAPLPTDAPSSQPHSSSPSSSPSSDTAAHEPVAVAVDDEKGDEPAAAEKPHEPVTETSPTTGVTSAERDLLEAAAIEQAGKAPEPQLSDVDALLLAERLADLIKTQRIEAARAADPTNYLASAPVAALLDDAARLAREADERSAAHEAQLAQLGERVRAVERQFVAELDVAQRLHRFERATLGLSGALQQQRPFGAELTALVAASQAIDLPALQSAAAQLSADDARRGVLQMAALRELFVDVVEASKVAESLQRAGSAPIVGSAAPGWWQRGYAAVVRNVTVWPSGVPAGDGPTAVAARAQWHLEHGELAKSLAELRRIAALPEVAAAAAPFLSEAERRLRLENIVKLATIDIDRLLGSSSTSEQQQ